MTAELGTVRYVLLTAVTMHVFLALQQASYELILLIYRREHNLYDIKRGETLTDLYRLEKSITNTFFNHLENESWLTVTVKNQAAHI